MDAASARKDHLVETALRLFYKNGFHATGIDTILAEAGVAKMTLYKHFKSKDELILAALEMRDRRWMEWFVGELSRRNCGPQQRLLAIFDVLADWFAKEEFRGCLFINAASEYGGHHARISDLVLRHKKLLRQEILRICNETGVKHPADLSDQIALLVEGTIVMALMDRSSSSWASTAKEAASTLLKSALSKRVGRTKSSRST